MKKLITLSVLAMQLAVPMLALAQFGGEEPVVDTPPINDLCGVIDTINTITNWLLVFLVVLAVIFVIIAAFNYLSAGGDSEKVGEANKKIIYAAVAVAVGLLAKALPWVVTTLIGGDISACGSVGQGLGN